MKSHTFILDGIWGRPRRWRPLRRMIEDRCGSAEILEYDSSGTVPFEELGARFADAVRRIHAPVNVVGFSMGGLVVRAARLVDPTLPLRRVAFLNSPHEGSWLAYLLPLRGVWQLRPTSPFIARMRQQVWDLPTLVVWNVFDQAIIPPSSTRWSGATAEMCCGLPMHIWPIFSTRIHERVVSFLREDGSAKEDEDTSIVESAACGFANQQRRLVCEAASGKQVSVSEGEALLSRMVGLQSRLLS